MRIQDYGIIGDAGSAALISDRGSIDWLCWPQFHSPAIFARLLSAERGGHCSLAPQASEETVNYTRNYRPNTAILETHFVSQSGEVCVTDFMTAPDPEVAEGTLHRDHHIVRRVECRRGAMDLEFICDLRPDYGAQRILPEDRGKLGHFYRIGNQFVRVAAEVPMRTEKDGSLSASLRVSKGDAVRFVLSYENGRPNELSPLEQFADLQLEETERYWRSWSDLCSARGNYSTDQVRSLITLKLLTHASRGAMVAAPTTSLPEEIGGSRNWDYRYCWIRDAVFTLRALSVMGHQQEGDAFFGWLINAVGRHGSRLHVVYDVFGAETPDEITLDHLSGYRNSRPVRVGNDATRQFQLDIYGETLLTASEYVAQGGTLDQWERRLLISLGHQVTKYWNKPDAGIWEKRSDNQHHTHSVVLCWCGLNSLLKLDHRGAIQLKKEERRLFDEVRTSIRETVESRGYNKEAGHFSAVFGGTSVDASLLLIALCGFLDASDPRMQRTYKRIQEKLARGPHLHRYLSEGETEDGLRGQEGTFVMCGFWAVEYLALAGRLEEAERRLEQLLACGNDLGLFSEEIDASNGDFLGNFPQAFTHVGLIHAVARLKEAKSRAPQLLKYTTGETFCDSTERFPSSGSSTTCASPRGGPRRLHRGRANCGRT